MTGMRIVGVHGVGNYDAAGTPAQAAERLAAAWAEALGIDVDLRVAYYAHHLHGETAQSIADIDALDDQTAELVLAWGLALGAPAELTQGPATMPLRHLADWVARRYGLKSKLVRWFVVTFFREVAAYLREPEGTGRAAARDEVAALIDAHRPDVVIAHSLGSVVTYEALSANPRFDVGLLVTLGSPLGMPDVVYDRLLPAPPVRPACVRHWVNVADIGDLVAIPRKLGGLFTTDADHEETIGLFDFHRVRKYLAAPRVRELLSEPAG